MSKQLLSDARNDVREIWKIACELNGMQDHQLLNSRSIDDLREIREAATSAIRLLNKARVAEKVGK